VLLFPPVYHTPHTIHHTPYSKDGTFDVMFDDGAVERAVTRNRIQLAPPLDLSQVPLATHSAAKMAHIIGGTGTGAGAGTGAGVGADEGAVAGEGADMTHTQTQSPTPSKVGRSGTRPTMHSRSPSPIHSPQVQRLPSGSMGQGMSTASMGGMGGMSGMGQSVGGMGQGMGESIGGMRQSPGQGVGQGPTVSSISAATYEAQDPLSPATTLRLLQSNASYATGVEREHLSTAHTKAHNIGAALFSASSVGAAGKSRYNFIHTAFYMLLMYITYYILHITYNKLHIKYY
jgi:hypothetical protein